MKMNKVCFIFTGIMICLIGKIFFIDMYFDNAENISNISFGYNITEHQHVRKDYSGTYNGWAADMTGHWTYCSVKGCNEVFEKYEHRGGTAQNGGCCSACTYKYLEVGSEKDKLCTACGSFEFSGSFDIPTNKTYGSFTKDYHVLATITCAKCGKDLTGGKTWQQAHSYIDGICACGRQETVEVGNVTTSNIQITDLDEEAAKGLCDGNHIDDAGWVWDEATSRFVVRGYSYWSQEFFEVADSGGHYRYLTYLCGCVSKSYEPHVEAVSTYGNDKRCNYCKYDMANDKLPSNFTTTTVSYTSYDGPTTTTATGTQATENRTIGINKAYASYGSIVVVTDPNSPNTMKGYIYIAEDTGGYGDWSAGEAGGGNGDHLDFYSIDPSSYALRPDGTYMGVKEEIEVTRKEPELKHDCEGHKPMPITVNNGNGTLTTYIVCSICKDSSGNPMVINSGITYNEGELQVVN